LARIFAVLAVIAWLLLAANFVVGLAGGDFNAAARAKRTAGERMSAAHRAVKLARRDTSPEFEAARREYAAADEQFQQPRFWMTLHLLLGSAAALMAILVSSITITYFIGTSRWCKEVCDTYKIEGALAERAAKIKRSAFPWALVGVLTIITIVGLGAAADPSGANFERSASLVLPHYIAAMAGLVIVAVCFWMQTQRIAENYRTIEEILAEVKRIRDEKSAVAERTGWSEG
jgi:hypothetical protein